MNTKRAAAISKLTAALRTICYRAGYLSLCLLILWLIGPRYAGAQSTATGTVEGAVLVLDSAGASYVPGAKVILQTSETLKTETDADGHYSLHDVAPGTYTITASFPGLQAVQEIAVQSGADSKVDLELKPVAVQTSVTVSDTDNNDTKAPTVTETITEKTIADAPNVNDRFESLLPLVPGVVRQLNHPALGIERQVLPTLTNVDERSRRQSSVMKFAVCSIALFLATGPQWLDTHSGLP